MFDVIVTTVYAWIKFYKEKMESKGLKHVPSKAVSL